MSIHIDDDDDDQPSRSDDSLTFDAGDHAPEGPVDRSSARTDGRARYVEHVHCSRCGKRCSGVDPQLGLVVRAWVECPECIASDPNVAALIVAVRALDPAAADDEPYHHWDAAKWNVFNAAVRFVRENLRIVPRTGDDG